MAARVLDILIKLTGADQITAKLAQIDGAGKKTAAEMRAAFGEAVPVLGAMNQQFDAFVGVLKGLPPSAGIAALAVAGLAVEVKALTFAMRELDAASQRTGILRQSQGSLGGVRAASAQLRQLAGIADGGLTSTETAALLNKAQTRGIDLATFKEILATANELSAVTGNELIPTIEQLNQAVGTGTVRAFASAGADVRALIAEFGEGRLTIEETRLVMERLREQVDGSGDSVSDAFTAMKKDSDDAWQAMLNSWAENPLLIAGLNGVAVAVDTVSGAFINMHSWIQESYQAIQNMLGLTGDAVGPGTPGVPGSGGYSTGSLSAGSGHWSQDENGQRIWVAGPDFIDVPFTPQGRADSYLRSGGGLSRSLLGSGSAEEEMTIMGAMAAMGFGGRVIQGGARRRAGEFARSQADARAGRFTDFLGGLPSLEPPSALMFAASQQPRRGAPIGDMIGRMTRGGNQRANGGGTNMDEIASLAQAGMSGGWGGLATAGASMVFANTLSAASLLGPVAGPVVAGMLATGLGGLFEKHQRETIRGPIEVEDKRVADILGGLNSAMNELIRLATAGGADRLFADANRQAVSI